MYKHKKIVPGQPVHVWQWPLSNKIVTLTPNLSNLIVINPVFGKKFFTTLPSTYQNLLKFMEI